MAKPPKLLRYPLDIIDSTTDYMFIEVLEYTPGGLPTLSQSSSASFSTQLGAFMNKSKAIQSIILPMPNTIAAVNRTGWGESKISALAGAGLAAAGGVINAVVGDSDFKTEADKVFDDLKTGAGGAGNEMIRKYFKAKGQTAIVNAIAGSNIQANQVLARQSGQIVNQNVELLFNSVSIRPFGFQFDFTPRNVDESKAVMQILTTFKKAAAAKRTGGSNGFLKTPDVFRITYKKGIDNQKYLNKFKVCALTQVGVTYTGSGIHATYDDGTPVHYKLDLAFTELEPIYAEDYGDNYDEAGF
jgi:hypothetical protein